MTRLLLKHLEKKDRTEVTRKPPTGYRNRASRQQKLAWDLSLALKASMLPSVDVRLYRAARAAEAEATFSSASRAASPEATSGFEARARRGVGGGAGAAPSNLL